MTERVVDLMGVSDFLHRELPETKGGKESRLSKTTDKIISERRMAVNMGRGGRVYPTFQKLETNIGKR